MAGRVSCPCSRSTIFYIGEEECERLPQCLDQGVGVIPWSPMAARGRLTSDWDENTARSENDAFALKMYQNAAELDKPVVDVVARIAQKHGISRAHIALAWLLSKPVLPHPLSVRRNLHILLKPLVR